MSKKQMVIGALIHANGSHAASWLMPEAQPHASTDIDYYRAMAQTAERGKFDFFFIADTPAARTENLKVHRWITFPMGARPGMSSPQPMITPRAILGSIACRRMRIVTRRPANSLRLSRRSGIHGRMTRLSTTRTRA